MNISEKTIKKHVDFFNLLNATAVNGKITKTTKLFYSNNVAFDHLKTLCDKGFIRKVSKGVYTPVFTGKYEPVHARQIIQGTYKRINGRPLKKTAPPPCYKAGAEVRSTEKENRIDPLGPLQIYKIAA